MQFRGLASYTIPRADVPVSGTWSVTPGDSLAANYVVNNAVVNDGPHPLGRNLSGASNVTINLIERATRTKTRVPGPLSMGAGPFYILRALQSRFMDILDFRPGNT